MIIREHGRVFTGIERTAMNMSFYDFLLPFLVAACAVPFAIFVGRAQASRMRELRDDLLTGKSRGNLVIFVVIMMILASAVF
ncbi:MAG: hypothetical protein ACRCS9_06850 [Hyphomicrobium sp.]